MEKLKNYRTLSNYKKHSVDNATKFGEYYDLEMEPSLTDPSQALEVKDILNNFTRGGAVRVLRPQKFGEVEEFGGQIPSEFNQIEARFHRMDKVERKQAAIKAGEIGEYYQKQADKKQKEIQAKAKAKEEAAKAASKENPKGDE